MKKVLIYKKKLILKKQEKYSKVEFDITHEVFIGKNTGNINNDYKMFLPPLGKGIFYKKNIEINLLI